MNAPRQPKALLFILIVVLLTILVIMDGRRRAAETKLKDLTVRLEQLQGGNTAANKEAASQIIAKVRHHLTLPTDADPTVALIVDAKKLQQSNPFYAKAENGDYLLVTPTRAILYSAKKDVVLDVIPVQISPPGQASEPAGGSAKSPQGGSR